MTKEEFFENQPGCKDCIHYPTCELIDDPELDSEFCCENIQARDGVIIC
jgi:hypothetical protein